MPAWTEQTVTLVGREAYFVAMVLDNLGHMVDPESTARPTLDDATIRLLTSPPASPANRDTRVLAHQMHDVVAHIYGQLGDDAPPLGP